TLTVRDAAGVSAQSRFRYANVYNPAAGAGYLIGSGQVNSPLGAFTSKPGLAGLLTVSKISAKYGTDGTLGALTNGFSFSYTPGTSFVQVVFNRLDIRKASEVSPLDRST